MGREFEKVSVKSERCPDELPPFFGFPGPPPREEGEPLRVLVINRIAKQEGQECWADYLARGMADDIELRFVVAHEDEDSGHLLREHGEVAFFSGEYDEAWWKFLRVVMDFRPHVAHTSFRRGAEFAKRAGLPCLCTVHGIVSGDFYGANVADISVGVSPAAKNDTDGYILNGVQALPYRDEHEENLVVWFGRTDEDRHPIPFLEALCRLPYVRAMIVGRSCEGRINIREEIVSRRLQNRVEVFDTLTPEEAREKAAEASVVVGTVNESFGCATAELMTAGVRPVVIHGPGYQTTMAKKHGVMVRPTIGGIIEGIARGLELAKDKRGNRKMAEWATRKFSHKRMASEYRKLYMALERPTIDIVVMAWNELEVTKSCINTLIANTYTPYRLILLDNGSEEPVYEYFQSVEAMHPNVVAVRSEANLGCPMGRELIYEKFPENEFFFWLDNDMLVPPGWLGPLYDVMRSDPNIGSVAPWNTIYTGNNRLKDMKVEDVDFHGSNNLYRRSAVEAVKEGEYLFPMPFREMNGREDSDLLCRLREGGFRLVFDGTVRMHHLGGPLRGGYAQGMTRRHGDVSVMNDAEDEFGRKWKAFGKRRLNYDAG